MSNSKKNAGGAVLSTKNNNSGGKNSNTPHKDQINSSSVVRKNINSERNKKGNLHRNNKKATSRTKNKKNRFIFKLKNSLGIFKNIYRIMHTYFKMRPAFVIYTFILIVLVAIFPLLFSFITGELINKIVRYVSGGEVTREEIYWFFGFTIVLGLVESILYKLIDVNEKLVRFDWDKKGALDLAGKLSALDFAKHEDSKFQTKLVRASDNALSMSGMFVFWSIWIIHDIIQIIGSFLILVTVSGILIPVIIVSQIPNLIILMRGSKAKWGIWSAKDSVKKRFIVTNGVLMDDKSLKEIRIFGMRSYLLEMMNKLLTDFQTEEKKVTKKEAWLSGFASILESAVLALVELRFIMLVLSKTIEVGTYRFYMDTVGRFASATRNLLRNINQIYNANLYINDYLEIMDLENEIKNKLNAPKVETKQIPKIEFRNVTFKYPGADKPVFDKFSMVVNPGEDIAIVGENGAGKTTFVKLLCRFYDVDSGEILINGKNIKDIDLDSWYENIGVLFQDFNKYQYTVKENIGLGNVKKVKDKEGIIEASKRAGSHEFVNDFKRKYDQILSRWFLNGTELSGGQWQRIALARAFFRNANVLILDEPTSAIDAQGEYEIFQKIAKVQKQKTTIIISHRFSTVRKADNIYVIEKGKLIENGTHAELMQKVGGTYKKMFSVQAEGYK